MNVVGYGRCSTSEQAREGVSIEVQQRRVLAEAARREWNVTWLADEGISGTVAPEQRPRLRAALALLDANEAEALVVTKVDRVSRSTTDFSTLLHRAQRNDWQVVVVELGLDTTTPMGKAMANMAAVFAELERDFISQRTRDALAVRKSQGVRIGRPSNVPPDIAARILREYEAGATAYALAGGLNGDGVPTAQGGKAWAASTVLGVLRRHAPPQ